jgi:hypothetical protein
MRLGTKPFESSNPDDQLAGLVLRVIAALSPCTKASLIDYVIAAGDSNSKVGQTTSTPHRRKLVGDALLKLKGFAFIRFTQEQIAITDEGRRFLSELELIASLRDDRSVKTAEINRELQAQPGTRYIAPLRECATNLLARYILRIKRFCQDRLAGAGHGFLMNGIRARDIALEVWKGKVTLIVRSKAPTLVLILTRFSRVYCKSAQATANSLVNRQTQSGAALWKNGKVSWSSLNNKLAGLSRLAIVVGVLLVALSAAGSIALLSGNRATSKPEAPTVSLREPPIVWFYDGQDHPQQSIFVKRNFSGATWIEGISIRGENKSNQSLTAVQATLISDSGEQIELTVRATGGQQAHADAPNVPSGSEFSLEYGFHSDASGRQAGMPAEEFLSKYGGMIFRLRYTVPGAQRTLLEYFSPSRLKAQLADASAQRREFD